MSAYAIGGIRIGVRGDAAIRNLIDSRLRPLACVPDGPPDIEVSAGGEPPAKPRGRGRPVYDPPSGEVLFFDGEDALWLDHGAARLLCEPAAGRVRVEAPPEAAWVAAHPLFTIALVEAMKRRCRFSLHAGGAAWNGRSVLLPGGSGSGKTTLTMALVRAGFDYLGDDTVFLTEGLRVLAFPDEADLTGFTGAQFPELWRAARQTERPKRQVRPEEVYGRRIAWDCEPAALVFPRVSRARDSALQPMDPGEALRELAPNVLLTERHSAQRHLQTLGRLAASCPCYRLETGCDWDHIAALIRGLL